MADEENLRETDVTEESSEDLKMLTMILAAIVVRDGGEIILSDEESSALASRSGWALRVEGNKAKKQMRISVDDYNAPESPEEAVDPEDG